MLSAIFGIILIVVALMVSKRNTSGKVESAPAVPFSPITIDRLTRHLAFKEMDMSVMQKICETVFTDINKIPVTHKKNICGTSIQRLEFTLDNLKDYDKIMKCESQLKAAFDNDNVSIIRDGSTIAVERPFFLETLYMGDLLKANPSYWTTNKLNIPIGRSTSGKDVFANIEDLKHILVAGCSGSGKSVFLQSMLLSILARHNDAEIYILDPKRVEFSRYSNVPNCTVVTEIETAALLLEYLCEEMEHRYILLEKSGARDIDTYNAQGGDMKRIILMVDELGDIMKQIKKQAEPLLVRLAQKSRACGIHLVLATQYPTADIITGCIKQNIPTKICFAVPSTTASVVVLGRKGAEKLVGKGDMLYQTEKDLNPIRLQGGYVEDIDCLSVIANQLGLRPAEA